MKFKRLKLSISYLFCALALVSYLSYAPQKDEVIEVMKEGTDLITTIYMLDQDNTLIPLHLQTKQQDEVKRLQEAFLKMSQPMRNSTFQPILPEGTMLLDAQFEEGVIYLNFNRTLMDYDPQMETKLLSAIVFTATSTYPNAQVVLQIDGEELQELPHQKTTLANLNRKIGINNFELSHESLHDTTLMNIYYTKEIDNQTFYVPMSKRVASSLTLDEALNEIVRRVSLQSKLQQPLALQRVSFSKMSEFDEDGLVLHLNDAILSEEKTCKEEALNTLLLSIKETLGYDKVKIYVDDVCVNQHGSNDQMASSYFDSLNRIEF